MNTTQLQHPTSSMEEQLLEAVRDNNIEKLEYVLSHGKVNLAVTEYASGQLSFLLIFKASMLLLG